MNKKKALVCTILFTIVLFVLIHCTFMIKNHWGDSLYSLISSCICWVWIGERIVKFYDWLIKGDESK
jgi:hypothetical protein